MKSPSSHEKAVSITILCENSAKEQKCCSFRCIFGFTIMFIIMICMSVSLEFTFIELQELVSSCSKLRANVDEQFTDVRETLNGTMKLLQEQADSVSRLSERFCAAIDCKERFNNISMDNLTRPEDCSLHLGHASQPAASCAALLAFSPSSPSGYYWVRASNGSAVRVYCDMTLSCGGVTGGWTRVAELNVTDNTTQCPGDLRLRNDVMLCRIKVTLFPPVCSSAIFSMNKICYSSVCDTIKAYQAGSLEGFHPEKSINGAYVDGISLTHGSLRQHIWTFVAYSGGERCNNCPCANNGISTMLRL